MHTPLHWRKAGLLCCVAALLLTACSENKQHKTYKKNRTHSEVADSSIAQGEKLAAQFCQSCHMLPDPSLLDAATWNNGVLPQMGPRLGIFEHVFQRYPNNRNDPNISKNYYPAQPLLSSGEWQHIIDYYTSLAPDTLPPQHREQVIDTGTALFTTSTPQLKLMPPATCFVKIDTLHRRILSADIAQQALFVFNNQLQLTDSLRTGGAVVDMVPSAQGAIACNMGAFSPNNAKAGYLQQFITGADGRFRKKPAQLFDQLMRPVGLVAADLNGDGKEDYVINEFGYLVGALSWLENKGDNHFERHELHSVPGAIKAYVQDYNHDGKPDIWVLFAQGEEGIFLFTNKGNGQFDQQEVLRFPPSYGSTFFELTDFNKDGSPDIVYTCGDNGDYSTILKPYHGVYIYLNDGSNHFKQQYFFPVNGCYKALARDFDNDGDLDIATIAWFADYAKQPQEGFVYLQNQGNGQFKPFSIPEAERGRWITMDAADMDKDGKTELLLGNCSVGPHFIQQHPNWQQGPVWMLLKLK